MLYNFHISFNARSMLCYNVYYRISLASSLVYKRFLWYILPEALVGPCILVGFHILIDVIKRLYIFMSPSVGNEKVSINHT